MDFLIGLFVFFMVMLVLAWLFIGLSLFTELDEFDKLYRKNKAKFFVALVVIGPMGWICFMLGSLFKYADKLQTWLEE